MRNGDMSVQDLIGINSFSHYGIETSDGVDIVYFIITPTNISVLSSVSIGQKIHHLMQLLSAQSDLEIICTDARENFDDNKMYLDERIKNEPNKKVRDLLIKDMAFLDDIQLQMSTAREFLFAVRFRNQTDEQTFSDINRIEKLINEQGFDCSKAEKDDLKRILSRYLGIGPIDSPIDDTDGESVILKWIKENLSDI